MRARRSFSSIIIWERGYALQPLQCLFVQSVLLPACKKNAGKRKRWPGVCAEEGQLAPTACTMRGCRKAALRTWRFALASACAREIIA